MESILNPNLVLPRKVSILGVVQLSYIPHMKDGLELVKHGLALEQLRCINPFNSRW